MTPDRSNIVEFIAEIFARRGAESYLGEQVSMSEHMLQGAVLADIPMSPRQQEPVNFTLDNNPGVMGHSIDLHAALLPWDKNYQTVAPGQKAWTTMMRKVKGGSSSWPSWK